MVISVYNSNYWVGLPIHFFPKCHIREFYHFLSLLNSGILQCGILAKRRLWKKICWYLNFVIFFLLHMFLSNIHILVCAKKESKANWWREKLFHLTDCSPSLREASESGQMGTRSQELKPMKVHCLLSSSVTTIRHLRNACLGTSTRFMVQQHFSQLPVKKLCHRHDTGQSDGDDFSKECW